MEIESPQTEFGPSDDDDDGGRVVVLLLNLILLLLRRDKIDKVSLRDLFDYQPKLNAKSCWFHWAIVVCRLLQRVIKLIINALCSLIIITINTVTSGHRRHRRIGSEHTKHFGVNFIQISHLWSNSTSTSHISNGLPIIVSQFIFVCVGCIDFIPFINYVRIIWMLSNRFEHICIESCRQM